jgi:hypothetical protein
MRTPEAKTIYLSSRSEGFPEDFDGRGLRRSRLIEGLPEIADGAWLAEVEPAIPSPEGNLHSMVLLLPFRDGPVLPEDPEAYCSIRVGPAPGSRPEWMVGIGWYLAELAWEVSALPRSTDGYLAEVWEMFSRWVARESNPNPPSEAEIAGFRIGQRIAAVKGMKRDGVLAKEWIDRFESIRGFEWWGEETAIEWLERYASMQGTVDVPSDLEEDGRPIGFEVEGLARAYIYASMVASLEDDRRFVADSILPPADKRRLERLPGWSELISRVARSRGQPPA